MPRCLRGSLAAVLTLSGRLATAMSTAPALPSRGHGSPSLNIGKVGLPEDDSRARYRAPGGVAVGKPQGNDDSRMSRSASQLVLGYVRGALFCAGAAGKHGREHRQDRQVDFGWRKCRGAPSASETSLKQSAADGWCRSIESVRKSDYQRHSRRRLHEMGPCGLRIARSQSLVPIKGVSSGDELGHRKDPSDNFSGSRKPGQSLWLFLLRSLFPSRMRMMLRLTGSIPLAAAAPG